VTSRVVTRNFERKRLALLRVQAARGELRPSTVCSGRLRSVVEVSAGLRSVVEVSAGLRSVAKC